MKTKWMLGLVVFAVVAFSYSIILADGGNERPDPRCEAPPAPTNNSPLIYGTFTATRFRVEGQLPKDYSIQCVLKMSRWMNKKELGKKEKEAIPQLKGNEQEIVYLHTFEKEIKEQKSLCDYSEQDLFEKYWPRPCNVEIQKKFNLEGFPILTEIKILKQSDCENEQLQAIYGSFKIRVVPMLRK
ncbi:MAG: hypothetical protein A2V65_08175 [Deltaproteobacteria bacterium RBG_13_49_15]|nr:MAG: hypothetical protein A2V65_08175 [Deltaproteobacteria bacterium RBG_13_49_15]